MVWCEERTDWFKGQKDPWVKAYMSSPWCCDKCVFGQCYITILSRNCERFLNLINVLGNQIVNWIPCLCYSWIRRRKHTHTMHLRFMKSETWFCWVEFMRESNWCTLMNLSHLGHKTTASSKTKSNSQKLPFCNQGKSLAPEVRCIFYRESQCTLFFWFFELGL